ncbi:MAG: PAS domain S-box protein [Draconibacterium sp.]|nr:PAS domain S-box protein [Draconibacterium sp.]
MDGFWIVDVQGKLQEVNETYCRMSGYSEQELLLMNISELEHVDSKDDIIVHLQKIRNRGEDRFESRHRRKDGTIFDVEINVHYQAINGGRFVTFLHDITNRKQKEEEMRQSEERYKSLFQNSNIVYLLIDPENGEIKDANAAALQFYGWSHTEICGKNIFDINILSQQEVADEMQRAKDEKQNYFVFKHRLANGTICKVEVYSGPIQYSNKTYLYSVIHDITEKTRMEKAFIESEMKFRKYIDNAPHGVLLPTKWENILMLM